MARRARIPPPPTTSTFDATAWGDTSFSGSRHEAVLFAEVDLSDMTERRAAFVDCTFRDVRFNAATHTDAAFTNCTFVRCTFFDTRFTRCKVVGSLFDRCTYKLLVVEGGDWSLVGMPGADLGEASFREVRMREADLRAPGSTAPRSASRPVRGVAPSVVVQGRRPPRQRPDSARSAHRPRRRPDRR